MLVRILSTYHTYELFIENRWLTPVRCQWLFRPVLPKTDLLLYSCITDEQEIINEWIEMLKDNNIITTHEGVL